MNDVLELVKLGVADSVLLTRGFTQAQIDEAKKVMSQRVDVSILDKKLSNPKLSKGGSLNLAIGKFTMPLSFIFSETTLRTYHSNKTDKDYELPTVTVTYENGTTIECDYVGSGKACMFLNTQQLNKLKELALLGYNSVKCEIREENGFKPLSISA